MDLDAEIARLQRFFREMHVVGHDPETLEVRLRALEARLSSLEAGAPSSRAANEELRAAIPEELRR